MRVRVQQRRDTRKARMCARDRLLVGDFGTEAEIGKDWGGGGMQDQIKQNLIRSKASSTKGGEASSDRVGSGLNWVGLG